MAFRAVSQRLAQISAPIPGIVMPGIGHDRTRLEVEQLPEPDKAPNTENQVELVIGRTPLHGRERAQVGHEILDVLGAHVREARIRKYGIIVAAIWRNSAQQRVGKVSCGPASNPVYRVHRDIGYTKRPERRGQRQSAAKMHAISLARRGMARRAVAGRKDELPARSIAGGITDTADLRCGETRGRSQEPDPHSGGDDREDC